ncbi:GNAT family N-acetyltransferase [Actinoplanes sp. GCM10030250]|uniref:GNAT family N-acetyltransferase n=1 Tax=Actinoplanes sp. GCM10030250 TaxID=3273376 RepID=UPI00360D36D4
MPQPILRTDRLLLVPLADRHLDLEVELDSDPEVLRYLFGRARPRDEVVGAHANRMAEGRMVDGLGFWMAFAGEEKPDGFVGLMMLPPAQDEHGRAEPGVAELGYRVMRRCWRRGFASEASRELLRYAFEDAGQERVIALTMAVNAGSRGVMAAVGMRHVRTFHPEWDEPLPGAEEGEVEYAITRREWLETVSPRPR